MKRKHQTFLFSLPPTRHSLPHSLFRFLLLLPPWLAAQPPPLMPRAPPPCLLSREQAEGLSAVTAAPSPWFSGKKTTLKPPPSLLFSRRTARRFKEPTPPLDSSHRPEQNPPNVFMVGRRWPSPPPPSW